MSNVRVIEVPLWVIDVFKLIDQDGPAGWSACAPIWRQVEIAGSVETTAELEVRAMMVALGEMEQAEPELYRQVQTWRLSGYIGDRQEEAFAWLGKKADQLLA